MNTQKEQTRGLGVEVFFVGAPEIQRTVDGLKAQFELLAPGKVGTQAEEVFLSDNLLTKEPGWYWWSCAPGCLPDCDPQGPFDTEEEALADTLKGLE